MNDRVNIAILGGAHPHVHAWIEVAKMIPQMEIAAVWDRDENRGSKLALEASADFAIDLDILLNRQDINAVAIASDVASHVELVTAAARANKHIMCEKPMAKTLEECDQIIDAILKSGVIFYQIFPMRWDPVNQKIREIVKSGELGKISMIRKRHGHFYGLKWQQEDPGIWFTQAELAGAGAFLDEGIHAIDWMRWIFGEPVSVMAQIDTVGTNFKVDDEGVAIYRFEDRSMMVLHASWLDQAATNTTEIYGSEGVLIQSHTDGASTRGISETSHPLRIYWKKASGWSVYDLPIHFPRNQEAVVKPFIQCLLERTSPPVTMYDGRRALELVMAAYRSSITGQSISINQVTL